MDEDRLIMRRLRAEYVFIREDGSPAVVIQEDPWPMSISIWFGGDQWPVSTSLLLEYTDLKIPIGNRGRITNRSQCLTIMGLSERTGVIDHGKWITCIWRTYELGSSDEELP
jgi:hypothetical protein